MVDAVNISGPAVNGGGMMLDMSLMRGVWVDKNAGTAYAQAGCRLGDVDRETQIHGLAAVLGFGYLTRRYGWTSDYLNSVEMVTANGQAISASETENADLFWALCGGGGNFGVATRFECKLHSVGPDITAGAIPWRAEYAEEVLEMFRTHTAEAPPELFCVAVQRIAPPAPWLSETVHGQPIIAIFVCHTGSVEDGAKLVAPIKAFGSPVGDIIQRRPYVSQQSLLDATQPNGRRCYWKSEYLPTLEPALLAKTIQQAGGDDGNIEMSA